MKLTHHLLRKVVVEGHNPHLMTKFGKECQEVNRVYCILLLLFFIIKERLIGFLEVFILFQDLQLDVIWQFTWIG